MPSKSQLSRLEEQKDPFTLGLKTVGAGTGAGLSAGCRRSPMPHEGGTEDPQYPTHKDFMVFELTLWVALLDYPFRSCPALAITLKPSSAGAQTSDIAGDRFRPSPTATVCGLLLLSFAGYPYVGGSCSRAAVPPPTGARFALIWAVHPPELDSTPPPASLYSAESAESAVPGRSPRRLAPRVAPGW